MTKNHLCILTLIYFTITIYATKPGAKLEKLDEKKLLVNLYVTAVAFKDGKLTGAMFVWLPQEIKSQSLGKSLKEARELDHKRRMQLMKNKTKNNGIPRRLLHTWVNQQSKNKNILKKIAKFKYVAQLAKSNGEHHFKQIDPKKTIKAQIRWDLWPNGESFHILKTSRRLKKRAMSPVHYVAIMAFIAIVVLKYQKRK